MSDIARQPDSATLAFDVIDDGNGFDANGRGLGAGFVDMEDRLRALRGSLRVESAPGQYALPSTFNL